MDNKIDYVSRELTNLLNGKSISKVQIVELVVQGILLMRKFSSLEGAQKKQVLIEALTRTINNTQMDDDEKSICNEVLNFVVPPMIDSMIWIAKSGTKLTSSCGCSSKKDPA